MVPSFCHLVSPRTLDHDLQASQVPHLLNGPGGKACPEVGMSLARDDEGTYCGPLSFLGDSDEGLVQPECNWGSNRRGTLLRVCDIWHCRRGLDIERGAGMLPTQGCCPPTPHFSSLLAYGFVQPEPRCLEGGVSVREPGSKTPLSGSGSASSPGLKL